MCWRDNGDPFAYLNGVVIRNRRLRRSAEYDRLAAEAARSSKEREHEDVDIWAGRLAADLAKFTD